MRSEGATMEAVLEHLRREFDEAFARPHDEKRDRRKWMFLEVVLGPTSGPHLLPLETLAGIQRATHVIEVTAPAPAFVGLTGWKFRPCPVYDLEPMLDPARAKSRLEWVAFHDRIAPVGLAFQRLTRVVALEPGALRSVRAGESHGRFVREFAAHDGRPVPVIDVPAIVQEILQREAGMTPVTPVPIKEEGS